MKKEGRGPFSVDSVACYDVRMIVDAHTHIGFGGAIIADPASLAASMKKARIDKALVFAGRINGCSTKDLLAALAPFSGTLYPVGSLTAGGGKRPSKAQVEEWLASGAIHGL